MRNNNRRPGQRIGDGGDPLAALANAIRLGGPGMMKRGNTKTSLNK